MLASTRMLATEDMTKLNVAKPGFTHHRWGTADPFTPRRRAAETSMAPTLPALTARPQTSAVSGGAAMLPHYSRAQIEMLQRGRYITRIKPAAPDCCCSADAAAAGYCSCCRCLADAGLAAAAWLPPTASTLGLVLQVHESAHGERRTGFDARHWLLRVRKSSNDNVHDTVICV